MIECGRGILWPCWSSDLIRNLHKVQIECRELESIGRSASYWNAFLFTHACCDSFEILNVLTTIYSFSSNQWMTLRQCVCELSNWHNTKGGKRGHTHTWIIHIHRLQLCVSYRWYDVMRNTLLRSNKWHDTVPLSGVGSVATRTLEWKVKIHQHLLNQSGLNFKMCLLH